MFNEKIGESIFEISHKITDKPKEDYYNTHIHQHCEILLFIKGNAHYNIDGHLFEPNPYDLIFIPKGTYHCLLPQSDTIYENYVIDFSDSLLSENQSEKLFSAPLIFNIKNDTDLVRFFTLLDYYYEKYSYEDFCECSLLLLKEILIYCSYRDKSQPQTDYKTNKLINNIIDYITENIEKPITAIDISNHFAFSKSYIQNTFSQVMHIGIKHYIIQKKIFAAQNDLILGLSPNEVANKYGFSDYSSFFRHYKRIIGCSPRKKA